MPVKSIHNRRLYQQIADQLRGMINRGEYPPGSYLPPERELSQQFGVSRTSLREALIALEVIGLVRVRVGDGVSVVGPEAVGDDATGNGSDRVLDRARHRNPWVLDPELGIVADFDAEIPPYSLLRARRLIEPETAALAAKHAPRPKSKASRRPCSATSPITAMNRAHIPATGCCTSASPMRAAIRPMRC